MIYRCRHGLRESEKGTIVVRNGFNTKMYKNVTEYAIASLQESLSSPKPTFTDSRSMLAAIRLGKPGRDPLLQKELEKTLKMAASSCARRRNHEASSILSDAAKLLRGNGEEELAAAFDAAAKNVWYR